MGRRRQRANHPDAGLVRRAAGYVLARIDLKREDPRAVGMAFRLMGTEADTFERSRLSPLARWLWNEELGRWRRGPDALLKINEQRRADRVADEDARRPEIEELVRAGKSYGQIARLIGWKTGNGRPAKTKVAEAVERWGSAGPRRRKK